MHSSTKNKEKYFNLNSAQCVFRGSRFSVYSGVLAENESIKKDIVIHPGAVTILPILDESHVVLIRNERFAVSERLWELPAGTIEPDEKPIDTAKRELIEEIGYQTSHITPLCEFYTTPGFCNERMYTFVAEKLHFVGQKLEETEKITTEILSWKDVLQMVKNGTIKDGKTIATILYYQTFRAL